MKNIRQIKFSLLYGLVASSLYACASIGSPNGGDNDTIPPKFVSSVPAPNTTQFKGNKITLLFDEYITLEKPSEKIIITPPPKKMPIIKTIGKKITVELIDSLEQDVTYTFDFTDGIVDNNEKNALEGFTFSFSTGDVIDSLFIAGVLLNAENLEPMPNVIVGIHSNLSDTALTKLPFLRTSQTNKYGQFHIHNVTPGTYRIFALNDMNRNYKFDRSDEAIAFADSPIRPSFESAIRMDTIWKDNLTVDTILAVHYTRFTPDNLLLRLFLEDFEMQYLSKVERTEWQWFTMVFNAPVTTVPIIYPIGKISGDTSWYILEQSPNRKILTYFLTDSTLYQKDTLIIVANYLKHNTLNQLVTNTDTICLIKKRAETFKYKEKRKYENEIPDLLGVNITPIGSLDVFDTVKITFSEPPTVFSMEQIQIFEKTDTSWQKCDFQVIKDIMNPRVYYIDHSWPYEQEYKIHIDSAAITSIYGRKNNSIQVTFKTFAENEYTKLIISLEGNNCDGFAQLLDSNEKTIKKESLSDKKIIFHDVKPGKYFLRYIEDINRNGRWDTGNYAEKRQPEAVYYYPGVFNLKSHIELEQHWNIQEISLEKQKPLDIIKNEPKMK